MVFGKPWIGLKFSQKIQQTPKGTYRRYPYKYGWNSKPRTSGRGSFWYVPGVCCSFLRFRVSTDTQVKNWHWSFHFLGCSWFAPCWGHVGYLGPDANNALPTCSTCVWLRHLCAYKMLSLSLSYLLISFDTIEIYIFFLVSQSYLRI